MSEPVTTPVIISKYFLKNVLPLLGNVIKPVLSPSKLFPSRNLSYPSYKYLFLNSSYFSKSLLKNNEVISL